MNDLRNTLPTKLFDILERNGISTAKEILTLSIWDIQRITNLKSEDIKLVKNLVSNFVIPKNRTCKDLLFQTSQRLATGCNEIDKSLFGGFRRGTITEIFGESGSGKTQLALHAAIYNYPNICVYICTEDLFPIKRFNEMADSMPNHTTNVDYGKKVLVEHITEAKDLLFCVRVRLRKLLSKNSISIIVIDSVAAPFRVENSYVQRAEDLKELGMALINLAKTYNLAVICINQVTACFDSTSDVLPSLGLTWSNMVTNRLKLTKTTNTCNEEMFSCNKKNDSSKNSCHIRELSVVFAPDLPNLSAKFVITSSGIQGM